MTITEAKKMFGLKESDTISKAGIEVMEKGLKAHINQTRGKSERAKAVKELEAINTLKEIAQ